MPNTKWWYDRGLFSRGGPSAAHVGVGPVQGGGARRGEEVSSGARCCCPEQPRVSALGLPLGDRRSDQAPPKGVGWGDAVHWEPVQLRLNRSPKALNRRRAPGGPVGGAGRLDKWPQDSDSFLPGVWLQLLSTPFFLPPPPPPRWSHLRACCGNCVAVWHTPGTVTQSETALSKTTQQQTTRRSGGKHVGIRQRGTQHGTTKQREHATLRATHGQPIPADEGGGNPQQRLRIHYLWPTSCGLVSSLGGVPAEGRSGRERELAKLTSRATTRPCACGLSEFIGRQPPWHEQRWERRNTSPLASYGGGALGVCVCFLAAYYTVFQNTTHE